MGKARMNLLDVRAVVKELQALVGLRLANIYNLNNRTYILKFAGMVLRTDERTNGRVNR